jgi:diguanylate cyclase
LSTLPISELKIDRMFITDMNQDYGHSAIVRSIIDLAHNLGFRVVAEGIEDETVFDELALRGCDIAQGYLFARPMSIDEFNNWFNKRHLPQLVKK